LRRLLALLLVAPAAGWASHPLISEDPEVLGQGAWQLEAHGDRGEKALALSYGMAARVDLQAELPYERGGGWQDAVLSVKWQVYDRGGLKLLLKPELQDSSWALSFVAGRQLGRFELLGHLGYLRNRDAADQRASQTHASAALLYAATDRLKWALDLSRDTNPDPASGTPIREMALGAIYAASEDIDLGLGVKLGLSDPAEDRSLSAGIKVRW
jgi:hypothetical protein